MKFIQIYTDIKSAKISENAGVDRIMIDLEKLKKKKRQSKQNTFISSHKYSDIKILRKNLKFSELLVRINPLHKNSKFQIDKVIDLGADRIMLPMFRNENEVAKIIELINGRVPLTLLLETSTAIIKLNNIVKLKGIDDIHIGLNDLKIEFKLYSIFEIFYSNILEYISRILKKEKIPFGIGGITRLGAGDIPSKLIISEHKRLGSSRVIISRTFMKDLGLTRSLKNEIQKIKIFLNSKKINSTLTQEKIKKIINTKLKQKTNFFNN